MLFSCSGHDFKCKYLHMRGFFTYFAPGLCGSSLKVAKIDALSDDMRTEMAATLPLDNFNINRAK